MRALLRWFAALALSAFLLMLMAPGCGRSSLEPEELDASATRSGSSSGNPGGCGPATCANGCCDRSGVCQTGRRVDACGSIGSACKDCLTAGFNTCTDARVCARQVAKCDATTCPNGCCRVDSSGRAQCLSGTDSTACGVLGQACADCELAGSACDATSRKCGTTKCDATNCTGCCVGDLCLPGNSAFACGANGGQCGKCNVGEVCRITAGSGGRCEGKSGGCGPANCGGCCDANGSCQAGTDPSACGRLGEACSMCSIEEQCVPDGQPNERTCRGITPQCGPANCAGCCFGDVCIDTTSADFCGEKGSQCITCGPNQTCNAFGKCENNGTGCGPLSCAGCCVGDICAVGTQNTACGANGTTCQNCANQFPAGTCQSGSCQIVPQCDAFSCANGCCAGNVCVSGTQDTMCGGTSDGGVFGSGGGKCQDCTAVGDVCQNHQCVSTCDAQSCPSGCCQKGVCVSGIANNACGGNGNVCDNCSARGAFCDGLVVPRECSDQQSTCPAPFGNCSPGATQSPIKELQNVCTDAQLDAISAACPGDQSDLFCQLTINQTSAACQQCIGNFDYTFAQRTGLYNCAASSVSGECRHSLACASDCIDTSCKQCATTTAQSCDTLVEGNGGQCSSYTTAAETCASSQLAAGQRCSQFSYPSYSAWLRSVGDHFCGNGP